MTTGPADLTSIDAIIFDCDGVLVDSEALAWQAWTDVLAQQGVEVTASDVEMLTGGSQQRVYDAFAERSLLPPFATVARAVDALTRRLITEDLQAFEDARETLNELRPRRIPLGVATASGRARLDATLQAVGMAEVFDITVAGDEVARPKPAPDLYLAAASALSAHPARCIAVEDTATGIASARSAGLFVVGVARHHVQPSQLREAHNVVHRLTARDVLIRF